MMTLAKLAGLLAVSAIFCAAPVTAQPMKCSGEEKTCQSSCAKVPPNTTSACLTECGVRKSACMRTGCWNDGRQRYCGLAKQ